MLENIQSPFSLEQSLTQSMLRVDELRTFLCHAAQNLEHGRASLVVLPCNTAHVHIEAVRSAVRVPMLSITEEIANELKRNGAQVTAILGTRVTRESKIYDDTCASKNIRVVYPNEHDQLAVEKVIQRALSWTNDRTDTTRLLSVIDHVKKLGADSVVLACTDLQLCMPKKAVDRVFDSMKVLAEASVRELRKQ
jgi:aspartate racemase